jgi:hypothetical protein
LAVCRYVKLVTTSGLGDWRNRHQLGDLDEPSTRIEPRESDVRFTPNSGQVRCTSPCLLCANSGLMQRSKWPIRSPRRLC